MAIRRKLAIDDTTRERIKTSQLINRLTDHAFGSVELSPTQVRAIEILLRKTLPDLATIELGNKPGTTLAVTWLNLPQS